MEVIDKASNLEISYDQTQNILFCRWIGVQNTEGIKSSGQQILTHVRGKSICRVLNDNREVRGPWQEAASWAAADWFPEMKAAGLRHFAWVLSADIFAEISARRAMQHIEGVRPFQNYEEAYTWLLSQQ